MSKVLFFVNHDVVIYNFRLEIVEMLLSQGYEVVISSPYGAQIEKLKQIGCTYREIKISRHGKNPFHDLKLLRDYKKIIKAENPDMVFTFTIKPNVYGGMACKALGVPYVANITGLGTAVENGGIMQKITTTLYKIGLKKAQKVFFQNAENQEFMLSRGLVKGAYDLLPGSGVNLNRFCVTDYPNDETVNFIFVARVMKEKGIEQYFEAAAAIREKYPFTRFHVYGACEQDYQERLEELERQGVIEYHGQANDMVPVYQKANCLIHPTYYPEGLSNVLLESLASGRPIITTDRSGCREVVEDGINGFIVKQKNSEDLIDKIEKFLALSYEERKQMGLNGRVKVEREFDRQIVVEKYLRELKDE